MGYNQDIEWLRSPGQVDVPASGAANLDLAAAIRRKLSPLSISEAVCVDAQSRVHGSYVDYDRLSRRRPTVRRPRR